MSSTPESLRVGTALTGLTLKGFLAALGEGYGPEVSPVAIGKFFRFSMAHFLSNREVAHYLLQSLSKNKNELRKLKWHSNDKFVFVWVVYKFCELKHISNFSLDYDDWIEVGGVLENDHEFLKRKWAAMVRHTTCLLHWSEDEEELLSLYMVNEDYKFKWTDLAIKIHESLGRHILRGCKDVRERWYNYLDPTLKKGKWTEEEDLLLGQLVLREGKKWSAIARLMEGRTENQVKNRVNSLLKRNIISKEALGDGVVTSETEDIRQEDRPSPDLENNQDEDMEEREAVTSPLLPPLAEPLTDEPEERSNNIFLDTFITNTDSYSRMDFELL